jgi:hypothetical protein
VWRLVLTSPQDAIEAVSPDTAVSPDAAVSAVVAVSPDAAVSAVVAVSADVADNCHCAGRVPTCG